MSTLLELLQEAKELNIPLRNLIAKEDLSKASLSTIKKNIFGVHNSICIKCLGEF